MASSLLIAALLPTTWGETAAPPEWRQEAESFSTKSTGARFSDQNASGGAAWNLWTNGYVETTFTAATAGAKQFDVVARGSVAAGLWPNLKLHLDGVAFSEVTVGSATYQTYSATKSSVGAGTHTLRIEFTNDAVVGGEDRNLKVDVASVIPSGVEEWRQEAESMTATAGDDFADGSASGGRYWNLWSNGYLETTAAAAAGSGTKHVVVYARGDVAGGVWPNMRIWVDGVQLANHTVGTTTWQPYVTPITLSKGMHTLRIQFTNDQIVGTEDRNLKVDAATIVPVPNEWRQEAESFPIRDTTKGIATSSTLASGGVFWNQHSNGFVQSTMTAASTGRKEILVVARGFPAGGGYPSLKVWVGATLVTTLTIGSQTFTPYVVPATMNYGANTLKLEFSNDANIGGEDRNVHLDVVTLVGDNAFPFVQGIPFPANNSYVKAQSPLVAVYADPDGDRGYVDFEVFVNSTGTPASSGRSPQTDAGAAAMWTPGALVNGTSYKWRARAYDGTAYAGAWTAYQFFTHDSAAPVAPSVSSPTFPAGAWSGTDTTSGSFTFAPGASTDVVGYKYGLDENPPATDTTGTSATLTPGEGPHHLYVQSVDRAGNVSAVTAYAFNVGSGAVASPHDGDATPKRVVLRTAANPSLANVRYEWRRADTDAWATVPAADVTLSGVPVTWPVTLAGGTHGNLMWDTSTTLAGLDGPFAVRAVYDTGAATRGTRLRLDRRTGGAAVVPAGPGHVNLLTGNFTMTATDVAVDTYAATLAVNRTFNSRDPAASATGPYGPGWTPGLSAGDASAVFTGLTVDGSLRTVNVVGGGTIGFTAASANSFVAQPGMESMKLTRTAGSATPSDLTDDVYELVDLGDTTTVFTWQSTAFLATTITQAASGATTTYTYETVGGVTRIKRALAPVPAGVSCANPATTRGCRSITFDYAPAGTPAPGAGGGNYANRLRSVSLVAWNPATSSMTTAALAQYAYQPDGRLYEAWDPALPALRTRYAYDAAGRPASMTPPAEEAWTFAYTTLPNDAAGGRIASVSRSALSAGTATTTFVYNVPVSGAGAPADLSGTQLARWGQTDAPVDATAVFPPTQVPDGNQATGVLPSSYERASVNYLDVTGRAVNLSTPGGHLGVSEFDGYGNVVRELSASNRARALGASATDPAAAEAALAMRYSTVRTFGADGLDLLDEFGPEHDVVLSTGVTDSLGRAWPDGALVRARKHTSHTYDEAAPAGGPYHLVTTTRTSARIADTTTDADTRTTTVQYDWTLRQATGVATDPGGLNLVSRASYDATTGLVTKDTRPSGTAAQDTAATTAYSYYTAGAHPAYTECGNRPEWANLVCRSDLAAQPTVTTDRPAIPTKSVQYDLFHAPTTTTDKNGAATLRTTTISYDSAHRPWRTTVTGNGSPLETVETFYEAASGRATETRTLDGSGVITSRITRGFDALGRITSYTDANANTSTVTYDVASRPVATEDGKGTQTRHYDEGGERRGLLSRLVDSAAGTFTATYDADGVLATYTLPNALVRTTTRDEAGATVGMSYARSGTTWLGFDSTSTVHGQIATASSVLSSESYSYDAAGRLTKVADTVNGAGCTLRTYTHDNDYNRTAMVTRQPNSEGQCDAAAPSSTTAYPYDAASRLTTGYVYDALGRTTSVPAGDAFGAAMTATYYVNDLAHTLTAQDGSTATFTLDPTRQRVRTRIQDGVTKVSHYAADGDSAIWVDEGGGAWSRNIPGIDGRLAAVQHSASGVLLQLVNLHGDVVATATTSPTATAPTATFEATESGTPRDGVPRTFSWLGSEQRVTDPSGLMLMGVRIYNPSTGRFLQADPVKGGSANDYDYGNADPVNQADTSGLRSSCWSWSSLCRSYDALKGAWWGTLAWQVYFFFSANQIATLQGYAAWGGIESRGMRWSQDGCSVPGGINIMFVGTFLNSCKKHDFGYRNSRRIFVLDKMYAPGKAIIDTQFLGDMGVACWSKYGAWWQKWVRNSCIATAGLFFTAVSVGGWWPYTKGWWS